MTLMPYQEAPESLVGPELRRACAEAIHVIKPDGEILRAGRAVLFIYEELGYRRLARVGAAPPFVWAVELGYGIVARNRRFFSRFLFRSE
jgi:hypothetical protein